MKEHLLEWPAPRPEFYKAVKLWKAYHLDCDIADGTTGPVRSERRAASGRYARERYARMMMEAAMDGIPDQVMTDARDRALEEYERETAEFAAAAPPPGRRGG